MATVLNNICTNKWMQNADAYFLKKNNKLSTGVEKKTLRSTGVETITLLQQDQATLHAQQTQ